MTKKNVHEEPYFRSLSVSNHPPSQARSEAHKVIFNPPSHHKSESLDTKISIQSVKSIQRSRITAKMSDDLVCNVCGKQFKSQKKLFSHFHFSDGQSLLNISMGECFY